MIPFGVAVHFSGREIEFFMLNCMPFIYIFIFFWVLMPRDSGRLVAWTTLQPGPWASTFGSLDRDTWLGRTMAVSFGSSAGGPAANRKQSIVTNTMKMHTHTDHNKSYLDGDVAKKLLRS